MGNIATALQAVPKRVYAVGAILAAAVIVPATMFAWGPSRQTYTVENPAPHVTFNSITNNPNIGDERNFVGIREATAPNTWYDEMNVQPGKEYIVRMYVHNNAADNLNLVAQDVTARITLPTTTGKSIQVDGAVSATNATPQNVWDHATFKSANDFNLAYVAGSLKFENNVFGSAGKALPESIFTQSGALLGYDKLDGKIPGCFKYAGYVSFKVKPQFAPGTTDFTVDKKVRKNGATDGFKESVSANAGDTLNYRVEFKNTGSGNLSNVTLKDTLPTGVSYIPGTVKIMNANNPNGAFIQNGDNLFTSGINIGGYTGGSNALVVFNAKVAANDKLPVCGMNTLRNKASAQPQGQNPKEDTADVTVNKTCQPGKITVCDLTTKKIISIDENQFDSSKHSKNVADCNAITVCDLKTKTIVTITENQFDSSKHSKNTADCNITVCDLQTKQIVKITEAQYNSDSSRYSKNAADCNVTELPQTGINSTIATLLSLGSLAAIAGYAFTSSRVRKLLIG